MLWKMPGVGKFLFPKFHPKIMDVAEAIAPECKKEVVGIRPGEKIHEEMITASDSYTTYDLGKYFTILPTQPLWDLKSFIENFNAKKAPEGMSYNSGKILNG